MKRNPSASNNAAAASSNKNGGDNNDGGWMTTRKVGRDDKQIKKAANVARQANRNEFRERWAKRRGQHHMKTYIMSSASDDAFVLLAGFDDLSVDTLANIFSFLPFDDVMCQRFLNKKAMEAARKTVIANFCVDSVENYNALRVMTAATNLRQITLCAFGRDDDSESDEDDSDEVQHKYSDGEDPDERKASATANWTSHDIGIISNFRQLRVLEIAMHAPLNGRYPVLFGFPTLQKMSIKYCHYLKWDLGMLVGMSVIKELECTNNDRLTGNINNLGMLKDTLERVVIDGCTRVEGNFMDLKDFSHLREVNLRWTAVTGDIRDIEESDFSSLESLILPKGVYGGKGCEFQSSSDGPDVARGVYLLKKQRPELKMDYWFAKLSEDSPDWYESAENFAEAPFCIRFVEAGSCIGYRWLSMGISISNPCEVNWLDPEPETGSEYYEAQRIEDKVKMYKGFYQPPTEEEYQRLVDEYVEEREHGESDNDSVWDLYNDNESDDEWLRRS